MRKITILFALILYTAYSILHTPVASAHFVKSDGGIGAVLHVDPGDDPVAGEQSNIILEFKDTGNKFNLSNCDCKIILSSSEKEILNQDLEAVAADQSLSSVTPVIFPDKNIYKLKVTGNSTDNSYQPFELNYDIRVEKEGTPASSQVKEESNWWMDHIIHLVGGGIIILLLIVALFAQNKKRVAVIILVLLILGHSVPIKAIHASHDGPVNSSEFACCLPVTADITEFPEIEIPVFKNENFTKPLILNSKFQIPNTLTIRPPPFN